jgi:F-type H+-transporting ATPase subunit a
LKTKNLICSIFLLLLTGSYFTAYGQEADVKGEAKVKFNASSYILEHIADSHEWHIFTRQNGESVAIYLPVIVYSKEKGLNIFSSKQLAHGQLYKGYKIEEEGDLKGKIVKVNEAGEADVKNLPLDLSMTKTVMAMLSAALIGLIIFLSLARSYKKTGISHPKGIQSFLEPVVLLYVMILQSRTLVINMNGICHIFSLYSFLYLSIT